MRSIREIARLVDPNQAGGLMTITTHVTALLYFVILFCLNIICKDRLSSTNISDVGHYVIRP